MNCVLKCKKTAPKDGLDARMRLPLSEIRLLVLAGAVANDGGVSKLVVVKHGVKRRRHNLHFRIGARNCNAARHAGFSELVGVLVAPNRVNAPLVPADVIAAGCGAEREGNFLTGCGVAQLSCKEHFKPFVVGKEILAGPKQQIHNGRSNRQQLSEPVGTQE